MTCNLVFNSLISLVRSSITLKSTKQELPAIQIHELDSKVDSVHQALVQEASFLATFPSPAQRPWPTLELVALIIRTSVILLAIHGFARIADCACPRGSWSIVPRLPGQWNLVENLCFVTRETLVFSIVVLVER